ncbi:MAG: OmpA family protein [Bacteroidetes bacterium]|nr:OmpA family protein [Bacteroidota bacterium]
MRWAIPFLLALIFPAISSAQALNNYGAIEIKQRIYFDSSNAILDSTDLLILQKVATIMNRIPQALFEVEGHTDSSGTAAFNEKLGLIRAEVVKNQLVKYGVNANKLVVKGRGETEPIRNGTRYLADKCRRVEFRQVIELTVSTKNEKTKRTTNADVKIEFSNMPFGEWETSTLNGKHTWILPFRKKYEVSANANGFIGNKLEIKPNFNDENGSKISVEILLKPVVVRERINFESVYFVTGKAALADGSEEAMQNIYNLLIKNPNAYIEIRGHISQPNNINYSKDDIEQGLDLSTRRAKRVYTEMIDRGIDPNRMTYRGMGNKEMINPNATTEEEEKANRRVEILVLELE